METAGSYLDQSSRTWTKYNIYLLSYLKQDFELLTDGMVACKKAME